MVRNYWKRFYTNVIGIIFVIDSNYWNTDTIKWNKDELYYLLEQKELKNVPLLIFANKKDLPNSVSIDDIKGELFFKSCNILISGYIRNTEMEYNIVIIKGISILIEHFHGLMELNNINYHIQKSCAKGGDGLYEGLDWLNKNLKRD